MTHVNCFMMCDCIITPSLILQVIARILTRIQLLVPHHTPPSNTVTLCFNSNCFTCIFTNIDEFFFKFRSHNLDTTLTSASAVPYPLDVRISWRVFCALHAAGYHRQLLPVLRTSLHVAYASQLETLGQWHYSAMILMHIENNK